jgi:hypothetical protein
MNLQPFHPHSPLPPTHTHTHTRGCFGVISGRGGDASKTVHHTYDGKSLAEVEAEAKVCQ